MRRSNEEAAETKLDSLGAQENLSSIPMGVGTAAMDRQEEDWSCNMSS
jgi:hypothetical protein